MYTWLATRLRLHTIARRGDIPDRTTVLALLARFFDELLSGLVITLTPTLRRVFGLSVVDVGLLLTLLDWVAAVVEPVVGALIDVWRRRPLLVLGALGWATAVLAVAVAQAPLWLGVGFVLVGLASGALTSTGDVVLVEAHPADVERISTRSGLIDTVGALLAPALVTVAALAGLDWRWLLATAATTCLGYGLLLARTPVPEPRRLRTDDSSKAGRLRTTAHHLRDGVREVAQNHEARRWLAVLFLERLAEIPVLFTPLWLAVVVGASQAQVGVHVAIELVVTFVALLGLDRLLIRIDGANVLRVATLASVPAYLLWLASPSVVAAFVLTVPKTALLAPLWPIARGRALASVAGRAGTVTAIDALLGIVPAALLFGALAQAIGLTAAMASTHVVAVVAIAWLLRPASPRRGRIRRHQRRTSWCTNATPQPKAGAAPRS